MLQVFKTEVSNSMLRLWFPLIQIAAKYIDVTCNTKMTNKSVEPQNVAHEKASYVTSILYHVCGDTKSRKMSGLFCISHVIILPNIT